MRTAEQRASHAAYMRAYNKKRRGMPTSKHGPAIDRIWLDAAPLLEHVSHRDFDTRSAAYKALWRAGSTGRISVRQADEICIIHLGCHPAQIYGWSWYE